ncbi:MAG TPA: MBG domain-containing protein, partial [Streptosporangiaceae bacterium]|nr:MBG domain-containing protein [Streptosporangiaceae bacterium]
YNSSGQVVTGGSIDSPVAAYVLGTATLRAGDDKATLFGYLPVQGEAPGQWQGEQLGSSTTYPDGSAPGSLATSTLPVETGSSGDETIAQLMQDFPNNGTGAYAGVYVLRLRTSAPDEGLTTQYDSAEILVSGSTWSVVAPTTTTTLSSSANPSVYGQPVTFTATVAPADGGGTVAFYADGSATAISGCSAQSLAQASGGPYTATCTTTSLPAGSHTISADYSGDSSYPASSGTLTGGQTVSPAPLAADVEGAQTYGGSPAFAVTGYSGLVNGNTASVVTGTITGCITTVGQGAVVGVYSGTISGCSGLSSPNYTITYSDAGFTVIPAPLTITASSGTMTYGGSVPTITASYSGFVNGNTAASLTTAPACSTTASSSMPAGSYPSSCTGAVDPNYMISYVGGTVTVGQAALTITASSGTMTYGGTPPAITPAYSGFVNKDTASSLTTAPACSTTATSSMPAGSYPSSCTGAVDPNYAISYVTGTVTVTQAGTTLTYTGPQTIAAGTALVPSATLASPASACQASQTISFSLNTNPVTGAAGPYTLGSAVTNASGTATGTSVSTTGWQAGAYTLAAAYAGTSNCAMSTATSPLAVTTAGLAAVGAGTYPVTGAGTVKFGFVVALIPHTTKYSGSISLVSSGWWLNGSLASYVNTSSTQGQATGTGSLYWWNQTLNHGLGGWQLAKTGVAFTITFAATTKTTPGAFGIQISYTPASPQPTPLPTSAVTTLKTGAIIIG